MLRINLGATAAVLLIATASLAETPNFGDQTQALNIVQRGRLMMGQNWWSRYGEPVNAVALADANTSPSDKGVYAGTMPMYGHGYAFAPGSCDCPPPCISDLWAGYVQDPWRCHPHGLHGRCGAGHGCCGQARGHCGGCDVSCGAAAPSCGTPVSCSSTVSDCGCKPICGKCRHFHRGHGFLAHWHSRCDSCAAPIGCGCATPVAPFYSEKQAIGAPPKPLAEEATLLPLPRLN